MSGTSSHKGLKPVAKPKTKQVYQLPIDRLKQPIEPEKNQSSVNFMSNQPSPNRFTTTAVRPDKNYLKTTSELAGGRDNTIKASINRPRGEAK